MADVYFGINPRFFDLIEQGVKTVEFRVGEKAQRVRPGDRIIFTFGLSVLRRRVDTVLLKKSFADARNIGLGGTGFDTWEDCEQTLRNFYGGRLEREPFTIIYLEDK